MNNNNDRITEKTDYQILKEFKENATFKLSLLIPRSDFEYISSSLSDCYSYINVEIFHTEERIINLNSIKIDVYGNYLDSSI